MSLRSILLSSCILWAGTSHAATVAAGESHSCEIRSSDGAVRCWGTSDYGQLGDGQYDATESSPVVVQDLVGVQAITAGRKHTCALKAGAVYCWGRGIDGQLGNNDSESMASPQPVTIQGVVVQIDAGDYHTCAVTEDGVAYCWGRNDTGQLGIGAFNPSIVPVPVANISDVTRISAGRSHTCALANGAVYCWGSNSSWESGQHDGEGWADILLPNPVNTLQNATDISAGDRSSCAVQQGSVYCWGLDFTDQPTMTKEGSPPTNPTPAIVEGLLNTSSVIVGDERACAISEGQLYCWGSRYLGILGDGHAEGWAVSPIRVPGLSDVSSVALGLDHTCARSPYGVACWGSDAYEQLGDSHAENWQTAVPQDVAGLGSVEAIDGRWQHSCVAAGASGNVMCWGANTDGAVDPLGPATPVARPRAVAGLDDFGAVGVATGTYHSCALNTDGIVMCWGRNVFSGDVEVPTAVPLPDARFALHVAAGLRHTCVVAKDTATDTTEVYCWGQNGSGQLGLGDTEGRSGPTLVQFPTPMTSIDGITVGSSHSCIWQVGSGLYCWGKNTSGQLGVDSQVDQLQPTQVDLNLVAKARAGSSHTCAEQWIPLSSITKVWCWGNDSYGQQGNGVNDGNVVVPQLVGTNLSLLGAGAYGACARNTIDGINLCWGNNMNGQLAIAALNAPEEPTPTAFTSSIADTALGSSHTCVLMQNGKVQCAGSSLFGQRGDGSRLYVTTPLFVDHLFDDGFD